MSLAILDRYELADDFEHRANDFDFPVGVWSVAAELSEVHEAKSPSELAKLTGQSADQIREALDRLVAKQLVRQNLISWKEFTAAREEARNAAGDPAAAETAFTAISDEEVPSFQEEEEAPDAPAPPSPSPPEAAAKEDQSAQPVPPNGHLAAQEGVALRLGSIAPQKAAVSSSNGWVWQKPETSRMTASIPVIPASTANGGPFKGRLLRPILAQIENLKGGGVEGQLLVYQVFLRVPYQLLHEEGIKALHLVDERTVIQNPVLHSAIVKAAKEVTGVELM